VTRIGNEASHGINFQMCKGQSVEPAALGPRLFAGMCT
jgi:hypothetical protein